MTHDEALKQKFHDAQDLESRIALVMAAQAAHTIINRKTLMAMYGITQIQAGALMRDFIHTHARNVEWNAQHSHYEFKEKEK